ncbi:MAG TPA: FecR domain-containing protein [Candidatus Paceibacterota bacterium]|nr:FecR domain-containing protein [Candidatus Paceibacterota bacterium]
MKLMKRFTGGLVALAVVAALSAQAAEQGIVKVVNIHGAARYTTPENPNWRPLKAGTVLKQGAVIQTAAESWVDMVLNNPNATTAASATLNAASTSSSASTVAYAPPKTEQDAVRIYENSVLGLDKLNISQTGADKVTETELDLKAGRILGTVKKLSAASKYEIKIPSGVAGVRGTIYSISADGILSVYSGSVVLSYVGADGTPKVQEVKYGQRYDAKTGVISDIPPSELKQALDDASKLRIAPTTMPTTFTVDRTVYYVSENRPGNE